MSRLSEAALEGPPEGWPFWAPSDMAEVEHALDVAGLQAGEHLIDLGCGDGQVLVAAARRGASVEGVDSEADLVEQAAAALESRHLHGSVYVGDVFESSLDADVLFTYLSPGTLQRLAGRLQTETRAGTRLVCIDYHVPGLQPEVEDGRVRLYRLPAPAARPSKAKSKATVGWPSPGLITTVPPDVHSLTTVSLHHPGGGVVVEATGDLAWALTLHVGTDHVPGRGDEVAVDIRWEPLEAGTLVVGTLACEGVGEMTVATVPSDEEHELWEVNAAGVARLHRRRQDGRRPWAPRSVAELLDACDDERYDP